MRILLVEDEFGIGDAVSGYLGRTGRQVEWVRNFEIADAAAAGRAHDMLIVDLRLPDGNGLDLVRKLRDEGDVRPLIIISAQDQIRDRIAGLNAGADDYLVKPFNLGELEARVQALQRRILGRPSPRIAVGNVTIDTANRRVWVNEAEIDLSRAEWIVLARLCASGGAAVTREQLHDSIFAAATDDAHGNAVEVYINRLRRKLGTGTILNKRGVGYRLAV